MATLPSVKTKLTVEAVQYRSLVSEFLAQTIGRSVNYLIDKTDAISAALSSSQVSSVIPIAVGGNESASIPSGYTFVGLRVPSSPNTNGLGTVSLTIVGPGTVQASSGNFGYVGSAVKNVNLSS